VVLVDCVQNNAITAISSINDRICCNITQITTNIRELSKWILRIHDENIHWTHLHPMSGFEAAVMNIRLP
jgi:hypothetical protein